MPDARLVLIADAGEQASLHYVEFFIANIPSPNARRAYVIRTLTDPVPSAHPDSGTSFHN